MNAYSKENRKIDHRLSKSTLYKKMQSSAHQRKILIEEGEDMVLYG